MDTSQDGGASGPIAPPDATSLLDATAPSDATSPSDASEDAGSGIGVGGPEAGTLDAASVGDAGGADAASLVLPPP